jgi:glycosyltransferase involved in cell wall biosynthesis
MRILIGSDHYPPRIGGAQIQTRLLAVSLHERGHTVAVATTWQPGDVALDTDAGMPVYRLRQLVSCLPARFQRVVHHQPPYPDPVTTFLLRRLIKRFQPDLVHSHGWFSYSCAAALLGFDIPLVVSARDYGYSCPTRTMLFMGRVRCSGPAPLKCLQCSSEYYGVGKGWLAELAVRGARPLIRKKLAGIHSVSNYVQDVVNRDLMDEFRNGKRSTPREIPRHVIHEMVEPISNDGTVSLEAANRLSELPTEPFILFVGALRREKGLFELLSAYQRLCSAPPLVLIGTIERGTPRAFPSGVVLITNLDHSAIPMAWERALFGVAPSLLPEPLGTVVCEAMSFGRAVIGTDHGGHPDVITNNVNGVLVPPGDVPALANAMQLLLDDPVRRRRLGDAARVAGREFAPARAGEQFEDLYRAVLSV